MAVDSLVDKTKLNNSLSYEADRIRLKTGGTADIAFDFANEKGFGDAIDAIPSGGGTDYLGQVLDGTIQNYENTSITKITKGDKRFMNETNLVSLSFPNVTELNGPQFASGCSNLSSINFPALGYIADSTNAFQNCTSLTGVVLPSLYRTYQSNIFAGCTGLTAFDGVTPTMGNKWNNPFGQLFFNGCSNLKTLVLRCSDKVGTLQNTNAFNGTPFASGGSGGTIYIPKSLYDHLGDGTSLDYKAATNWSTVNGYGTITWAQIEGSIYETQYADGTPIT